MLSPVSNDDEDVLTSAHSGGPPSPGADLAPWKKRIGAAIALVVIAAGSFGYSVRHENTPPPVVFEPGDGGASPAPLAAGDEPDGHPKSESSRKDLVDTLIATAKIGPTTGATPTHSLIVVHVSGGVLRPGVYKIAAGSRVQDAIAAAGGATRNGDVNQLNLAAFAVDGTHIVVPSREALAAQAAPPRPTALPPETAMPRMGIIPPAGSPKSSAPAPASDRPTAASDAAFRDATGPDLADANSTKRPLRPVDLNRAGMEELQTLPTIGPEMARRILEYRKVYGPFQNVEQLNRIDGIGSGKVEKLRPYVVIG